MRPIRFRAWDGKRLVVVNELSFYSVHHLKVNDEIDSLGDSRTGESPWPLMQFTGLRDRTGREIYEGDVVKWGHVEGGEETPHRIAEVKFCPDIEFHSQVGVFKFGSFSYTDTEKWLEILGNIYEHPHRLAARMSALKGIAACWLVLFFLTLGGMLAWALGTLVYLLIEAHGPGIVSWWIGGTVLVAVFTVGAIAVLESHS